MGTMTTPPICWATRGSLTRALTITPATTDDEPDRRAQQEDPSQPRRVGDDAEQGRAVDERREGHEDDIGDPAREHARHQGGHGLAGEQLDVRIGAASTGSRDRACFSPMIENVAIDSGM